MAWNSNETMGPACHFPNFFKRQKKHFIKGKEKEGFQPKIKSVDGTKPNYT